MSTYRKEWPCCDSVTETEAWEPEQCPFCTQAASYSREDLVRELTEALEAILTEAHSASKGLHPLSFCSQRARAALQKAKEQME